MVVIDMPMPESCRSCPLMETRDEYTFFCVLTKEIIGNWFEEWLPFKNVPYSEERRSDCPLIEMGERR